jgi:hypothetical protein
MLAVAGSASAGTPKVLGWNERGVALVRLPTPCSQCDHELDDRIHASDGAGHELFIDEVLALRTGLATGSEPKQPSLGGKPVDIELTTIETWSNTADHEVAAGAELEVVAERGSGCGFLGQDEFGAALAATTNAHS